MSETRWLLLGVGYVLGRWRPVARWLALRGVRFERAPIDRLIWGGVASRHFVARVLDAACAWIDGLPNWTRRVPLLHALGCPRGLALLAWRIDEPSGCEWCRRATILESGEDT